MPCFPLAKTGKRFHNGYQIPNSKPCEWALTVCQPISSYRKKKPELVRNLLLSRFSFRRKLLGWLTAHTKKMRHKIYFRWLAEIKPKRGKKGSRNSPQQHLIRAKWKKIYLYIRFDWIKRISIPLISNSLIDRNTPSPNPFLLLPIKWKNTNQFMATDERVECAWV